MERGSLEDKVTDTIEDILKFSFVVGLIVGGIWLFVFYTTEQKYADINKEINDIVNDLVAKADAFNDAISLVDYNNAYTVYEDYKSLCERLRIKYNVAPNELKTRDASYHEIHKIISACQDAVQSYSSALTNLRVTSAILGGR